MVSGMVWGDPRAEPTQWGVVARAAGICVGVPAALFAECHLDRTGLELQGAPRRSGPGRYNLPQDEERTPL